MKLFTVGPTQMRQEILDVRHQQVPYFRTTEFYATAHPPALTLVRVQG